MCQELCNYSSLCALLANVTIQNSNSTTRQAIFAEGTVHAAGHVAESLCRSMILMKIIYFLLLLTRNKAVLQYL